MLNAFNSQDENILEQRKELNYKRYQNIEEILNNTDAKVIIIYCQDGINQKTFEENIKKFNNKIIGKKISCSEIFDKDSDKGQMWIIKDTKTKALFIVGEDGGEQSHYVGGSQKNKTL